MIHFKSVSDDVLLDETLAAADQEKKCTLRLLEYLAEVDERRLYNARGYSTLWEFVHKGLGYSEAQASERVSAMRLMCQVPEVKVMLQEQKLSLTTTSKLAAFVKREECSPEKAVELLGKIAEMPVREVERVLVAEQSVPHARPDVIRPAGPETTRVSFDADPEFMALYQELQELQGRPDFSMNDQLKLAMRELIQKKKVARGAQVLRAPEVRRVVEKPVSDSRYVRVSDRREVQKRAQGQCEYVDSKSNRRCSSRFALQFDHIHAYAKGGRTELRNLQLLCASHNRYRAMQEFGVRQ